MKIFLLIGGDIDLTWVAMLQDVLGQLGRLELATQGQALPRIRRGNYATVIIDASSTEQAPSVVKDVRRENPQVPIIVVTASPTWQDARQVFLAGATDYVRKSLESDHLLRSILEIMSRHE